MSSISGINSASTGWSSVNSTDSKKTSQASELIAQLQECINGTSGSGSSDSDSDSGSKTSIERSVAMGADGSMIVTLTQITTSADGTTTSKVLSKTKLGGSTSGDSTSGQSNNGVSFMNAQAQVIMAKNGITSNYASNEYEQNSVIGSYISGVALKEEV